ncbi:MAG: allophanate hydrolase [Gammaproteobacteria bacterium]
MTENNYSLSIEELQQRYKDGSLTPKTLLSDIKTSIEKYQDHNIWIHILSDEELAPYLSRLEDKEIDELPLYGIPFAIKDNIDLAGIPTTAACPEYSYVPEESAFVVQCLIDAGAIPIGKTNLDQFATGLVGTRSPYGAVKNAFNPDYISGGSSSGSSVSVALGQVSFSLGTDTAGSGRVPAAFNNLIGLKPTKGRFSTSGVVPACRSLDCVSVFALNLDDAETVFDVLDKYDANDSYARKQTSVSTNAIVENKKIKIGVPESQQLNFFNDAEYETLFNEFIQSISSDKYEVVQIDFSPFIEAANLLYQGPWVAERYAAIEEFIENNADALFPVTKEIIAPAKNVNSVDAFKSFYQLQEYKRQADNVLEQLDLILTPTTGRHYRIDEVNDDPIQTNSNLGYYTNFMNLLDFSALAIPAGFKQDSLPFGVTLFTDAFKDEFLLKQAKALMLYKQHKMGATEFSWVAKENDKNKEQTTIDIAVCGAHLSGMPLNHQLTERGGALIKVCKTADTYRLYALAGGPPYRPGLIKVNGNGVAIDVEVWRMPLENFGSFMLGIPHPLGIGKAELDDGSEVNSFICEAFAIDDAEDITSFGNWRNYIKSIAKD